MSGTTTLAKRNPGSLCTTMNELHAENWKSGAQDRERGKDQSKRTKIN